MDYPPVVTVCLYCSRWARAYGRGLCQTCYRKPAVREQFPVRGRFRDSSPSALLPPALALGPTRHLPGTAAKMAVLAARFAAGVNLFHPQDAAVEER
jgi:hypothetical protein